MSTWLTAWRNRRPAAGAHPVLELRVAAGADAGNQFTLEGDEILIGRGSPPSTVTQVVRLLDKSISRQQAWIRREGDALWLVHIDSAANKTRHNGREIDRVRLHVGDRIEMGRVTIEVHSRAGTNLSGLTEIMRQGVTGPAAESAAPIESATLTSAQTQERPEEAPLVADASARTRSAHDSEPETTEVRPMAVVLGEISVLRTGADPEESGAVASRVSIGMQPIRIGRGPEMDLRVSERGVSRLHAEVCIENGRIMLVQKSHTNPTLANGFPVLDRIELNDGDEIALADRVVLGVEIHGPKHGFLGRTKASRPELSRRMEEKIDLDRSIESYQVMGTFLDIDVVGSRSMKTGGAKAEHIIVSFDRFRGFVSEACQEWHGQVLNCNGDELMCFFESAEEAVSAAHSILARLPAFNREQNLLSDDFRFRLGAHTGLSLVDLDAGIAYSEVLDTAGHIQKQAATNTLCVSAATLEALPDGTPATFVGDLTMSPGHATGIHSSTQLAASESPAARPPSTRLYRIDFALDRDDD